MTVSGLSRVLLHLLTLYRVRYGQAVILQGEGKSYLPLEMLLRYSMLASKAMRHHFLHLWRRSERALLTRSEQTVEGSVASRQPSSQCCVVAVAMVGDLAEAESPAVAAVSVRKICSSFVAKGSICCNT